MKIATLRSKALVQGAFSLKYRRPRRDDFTQKEPDEFPFDDLLLYATWHDDAALPRPG